MPQDVSLLPVTEVCRRCGISRPTVYRLIKSGKLPKPVYVAARAPRWRSDEIQEFIDGISYARLGEPQAA
ncbi:MAG: AlpA family phage regulatory protein [Alphaproteobacteria bacterium]|nr:AlpA family phage regulatory protein [Alphaproteobacteria bacterium]